MHASIAGIEYHLPESTLTSEDLAALFPGWTSSQIEAKTGIRTRHIAGQNECASDLAVVAAQRLFATGICQPSEVDFILLCTQSPDYTLPTTACLLQERLTISNDAGALDFNMGCSGFVYGLGMAEGLISSGQVERVLLITAETYSKYLRSEDKACRAIFGDGAAATLITAVSGDPLMGPFIYGTNGRGATDLIVRNSGSRRTPSQINLDIALSPSCESGLFMDGSKVVDFVLSVVPQVVNQLLDKAHLAMDDIDLVVFHQANAYLLNALRKDLGIPRSKMLLSMLHCGNTVSSTIPIALKDAMRDNQLADGALLLLVGFGVGYSWAATLIRWRNS